MSSLTSFTILLNLLSLETFSSSNRDTCVGCNSYNGDGTDLDLVPVYLIPITSIHVLLEPSSFETTSLSSKPVYLLSDCDLVYLGYVHVTLVASLATTFSL